MARKNRKETGKVLKYQINKKLISMCAFGQSRHEDKESGEDLNKIYSYKSFENYRAWCGHFADYMERNHNEVRKLEDAKQYVNEYIQSIREDHSAYTQKSYLSALRKVFDDDFEEVKTDKRCRSKIERSRSFNISNRKFSEEKHADFVHFCQHTGMRRSEIEKLKGGCVSLHEDGHYYIDRVKGKGGKVRDIRILNDDIEVINKINETPSNALVWGLVSNHANIHGWRADYAEAFYKSIARDVEDLPKSQTYKCQKDMLGVVLDKQAMAEVSRSLGHNRIGIIAQNYLYNL